MPRYAIVNATLVENVVVANATPVVAGRTVIGPLGSNQPVGPGDSYDGTNFTRRVPSAQEQTRAAAPGFLTNAYPTLRQWATDAQTTYDAAVAANRALTPAEQREFIRRVGILMNRLADMLAMQELDG